MTNHVLAGAVIGGALRRSPAAAFAAGVASHLAMDALPHWGLPGVDQANPRFLRVAYRDGLLGLAILTALAGKAGGARAAVVAGMAGATILDVDKPARYFFGRNPVPAAIQSFHERIQRESPKRLGIEVTVGAALASAIVLHRLLPASRR